MSNTIFDVLTDYDLDKPKNRAQNLSNLSPDEVSILIDKLEGSLSTRASLRQESVEPFDLWVPFASPNTFEKAPSYLFAFDRVCLLDPLYDLLVSFHSVQAPEWEGFYMRLAKGLYGESHDYLSDLNFYKEHPELFQAHKTSLAKVLDQAIETYYDHKVLIDEGVVVPFLDRSNMYEDAAQVMEDTIREVVDVFLRPLDADNEMPLLLAKGDYEGLSRKAGTQTSEILQLFFWMLNAFSFKEIFPTESVKHLEFSDAKTRVVIDKLVQIVANKLGDKLEVAEYIKWPTPEDELMFASISGIPPHELLELRKRERSVVEKFKFEMQDKLLTLQNAADESDYRRLLHSMQLQQKRSTAELEVFATNLKQSYLRKFAHRLTFSGIFAGAAVLSAVAASMSTTALLTLGLSSSGLAGSLANLVEDWITYKDSYRSLKEKDGYVLWRLEQLKRGALSTS